MDVVPTCPSWFLAIAGLVTALGRPSPPGAAPAVDAPVHADVSPPVVWITATEITYQGQLVSTPDFVVIGREESASHTLDALYERLDAATKKICQSCFGELELDRLLVCVADLHVHPHVLHDVVVTGIAVGLTVQVITVRDAPSERAEARACSGAATGS